MFIEREVERVCLKQFLRRQRWKELKGELGGMRNGFRGFNWKSEFSVLIFLRFLSRENLREGREKSGLILPRFNYSLLQPDPGF